MFEARVESNKEIKLSRAEFLQLSFTYITPPDRNVRLPVLRDREEFIIDIVHEAYLHEFLKIVELEHQRIALRMFEVLPK